MLHRTVDAPWSRAVPSPVFPFGQYARFTKWLLPALFLFLTGRWIAPQGRLTFPQKPRHVVGAHTWYDVNNDGRCEFALGSDATGRVVSVNYDDDSDGSIDRTYRLSEYPDRDVPHLILLLDSIPYRSMLKRYEAGGFRFCNPPAKVVSPFPSITEICFTDVLHAPMLPGLHDEFFDQRLQHVNQGLRHRLKGYTMPWEARLHYTQRFYENGLSFLRPKPWFAGELARVRTAIEKSPDRISLCYIGSCSGMLCKFGKAGCDEVLDGVERLCLQLMYERRGAIKFTIMADHGHNYVPSRNLDIGRLMKEGGFKPAKRIKKPNDVIIELNGLVTYAGIYTIKPRKVSDALLKAPEIEFTMHLEGDHVVLQSASSRAYIDSRGGKIRYQPTEGDPFGYAPVIEAMRAKGHIDAEGFASDEAWFEQTLDHHYPDAPRRAWDALHRIAVNTPQVLATLKPGYCAGLSTFETFISMASTHGSLSQDDSVSFVMSSTNARYGPMRSRDVLPTIEPDAVLPIVNIKPENKP